MNVIERICIAVIMLFVLAVLLGFCTEFVTAVMNRL